MSKSRDAFRTISEVSEALDVPAHVLRFWESKFAQVKPVKRAGGRRYYRPADVDLLAGIKKLLHDDGLTIKGAQKVLREQGVKAISSLGAAALPDGAQEATANIDQPPAPLPEPTPPEPEAAVAITNVVAMPAAPKGPAVSLNLSPAPDPDPNPDDVRPAQAGHAADPVPDSGPDDMAEQEAATPEATIPEDPSDSDSKAPARLFHLLRDTPADRLAAQAAAIAPLLGRMRDLRARIETR